MYQGIVNTTCCLIMIAIAGLIIDRSFDISITYKKEIAAFVRNIAAFI
jgi:hypothetical protein